ncbi:MAG: GNAT family N-acetyltransferase [Cyanobacteria bacterium J06627_3]
MLLTTIRQATINDAEALAQLAERTFRDTFTEENNLTDMELHCTKNFGIEMQQQEILDPNCATILAEIETQPVAFAQVRLHSPKDCVDAHRPSELYRLYVSKEWHGRGVAQQVMSHVLSTAAHAGANHIWLGVWEHNPRALAFYHKYGFKVVGEHVFQFGNDPQRDLIMMAEVKASKD